MISIIIVGYNSVKYLPECLGSIFASDYPNFKVFFIDNNSTDASVNYIRQNFPDVSITESKENLGFAGGNNLGIKEALKNKPDFLFLLNPDTIIDKNCLGLLAKNSKSDTILQPMLLLHEDGKKTNLVNSSGNYLNYLGISYCNDYRKKDENIHKKLITTASGAALFAPRNIIEKVGMFDESFFMYHEDLDLCWRARLFGYNIELVKEARVWHKYSFSRNKNKFYFIERNRLAFLAKNFSVVYLALILPAFLLNEIIIILFSIMGGWFLLKLRSYYDFIRNFPLIFKERKKIPKNKLRENLSYIGGEFSFDSVGTKQLQKVYNIFSNSYWKAIRFLLSKI